MSDAADESKFEIGDGTESPTPWPLFRLLRQHGRSDRSHLLVGAMTLLVQRIPGAGIVYAIGVAFDAIFNGKPYSLPFVPDAWIPASPVDQIWFTTLAFVVLFVTSIALKYVSDYAWNVFALRVQHAIRVETYATVQSLGMDFFDDQRTGDVMSVLNNDVNNFEDFLTDGMKSAVHVTGFVLGTGLFLVLLNWQLAIVALLVAPVIAVTNYWFSQKMGVIYGQVRSKVGTLNAQLATNINGMAVVKAYTQEDRESARIASTSSEYCESKLDEVDVRMLHFPSMRVLTGFGFTVTFAVGGYWILRGAPFAFTGKMTAGTLIPFVFYTRSLMWPMQTIASIINTYENAKASARRIANVRRFEGASTERDHEADIGEVDGHVQYHDVEFVYGESETPVVRNVNFLVAPGETVGIVGPTGAGKTTLLKLLLRFYDVDSGSITIDGTDVRSVTLASLRSSIGYVSQEPFLFYGSIRENIACGASEATDEEVREAAKKAGAHEFISDLPDGYDTEVGERGVKLSGGQRQRIAIARALVDDAPILVLDEATSHVDNETAVLIRRQLELHAEERTTFVVAHQLLSVKRADTILVLDEGTVVERGTHDELVDAGGLYESLWRTQVGKVEELPDGFVERITRD